MMIVVVILRVITQRHSFRLSETRRSLLLRSREIKTIKLQYNLVQAPFIHPSIEIAAWSKLDCWLKDQWQNKAYIIMILRA